MYSLFSINTSGKDLVMSKIEEGTKSVLCAEMNRRRHFSDTKDKYAVYDITGRLVSSTF